MPSEGQVGLGEFSHSADRPTAEAQAIAGDDKQTQSSDITLAETDGYIEGALQSIDYTLETTDEGDESPVIHVFARTPDGTAEHIRVRGMRPYFYVPDDEVDSLLDDDRVTGSESGFEAIDDTSVTRIYAQTPRDVGQLREGHTHYEADVRFPNRFLIDAGVKSGLRVPERRDDEGVIDVTFDEVEPADVVADPRVFFFDIEVDDRRGFPEDGEEPIISIAAHDSAPDRYIVWLYEAPDGDGTVPDSLDDFEPLVEGSSIEVRSYRDEGAMLDDFLKYVEDNELDLISGWNLRDFDAPYLLDRLERLDGTSSFDLSIERLSRVDEVWRSNFGGPDIKGLVVFDLLYAYRRTQFTELDSYRLDDVGEVELGVGKERYPGSIGDLWEEDPERLLEYNVRDVELCVELNKKQEVIAFWDEVRQLVGCQLEDAPTPGDTVDMYILHKVYGEYVLPSRGRQEGEEYEGGAVFEPITGIRENVSVLDLKSLYPMCMRTMNASPETKVDPEEYDAPTYRSPNDIHFRKEPPGIVREMVDELLNEREQKKGRRDEHDPQSEAYDLYDRQQGAVKVLMNCFTPDTEVVTPDGIVEITELEVGDIVYSLEPESLTLEMKAVTATHSYPEYRGELIDISNSNIDFQVTPNHRMLVRQNDTNGRVDPGWRFEEADNLNRHCHYEMPHTWAFNHENSLPDEIDLVELAQQFTNEQITIADGGQKLSAKFGTPNLERFVDTEKFLRLLAWYITEGNVYDAKTKNYVVKIAQDDPKNRAKIGSLVNEFVEYYYDDGQSIRFNSKIWNTLLVNLCGKGSDNKRIPEIVFKASEEQKKKFLEVLLDGDGSRRVNSWKYSTKSEQLRDDVIRLCFEIGQTAKYTRESNVWRIFVTENSKNSFRMYRDGDIRSANKGVYCVSVEGNGTLIAGRNGKFQHVGNSLYGTLGWTRFRLYDKDMGAAVTAAGRSVIEYTKEIAESVNKKVIYGDTDSIMVSVGEDVEIDEAIDNSLELEELINGSYDEFAKQELNAEEHYFEIEFEKLYRRFFQAGKKKRYAGHIVWSEGKEVDDIDITGFEYQRSDIAPITKEVQHEVLERIVREGDVESVKEYLYEIIERFESGEFSPEEIAIPGGIGKRLGNYETDTAHVRGAKYANLLLGTNFNRGSKPKRLYLRKVHPDYFNRVEAERGGSLTSNSLYQEFKKDPDVICFEYEDQLPAEFEIDHSKMLDKTLKGPISRILEALDLTWDEVKAGQTQTGLGQF